MTKLFKKKINDRLVLCTYLVGSCTPPVLFWAYWFLIYPQKFSGIAVLIFIGFCIVWGITLTLLIELIKQHNKTIEKENTNG